MKKQRILAVFLSVLAFIFTACPFLAYGATDFSFTLIQVISTSASGTTEQGAGNLPFNFIASDIKQTQTRSINLFFSEDVFNVSKDDTVEVHVVVSDDEGGTTRYNSMSVTAYLYAPSSATASSAGMVESASGSFDSSSQEITADIPCSRDYSDAYIVISLSNFVTETSSGTDYSKYGAAMSVRNGYVQIIDPESGFWSSVVDWFQQIFDSITEGFSNIGDWFSELGSSIASGFSNLISNISDFFTQLGNNLKSWFEDVGDWFSQLGDNISGFFEKLWNRIYWGNENGEAEYQPPTIDNKLNDIIDQLEDWQDSLKDTVNDINSASASVSGYISTGTEVVNGVIGVGGVAFTALITFGVVFVLVRKVVGR